MDGVVSLRGPDGRIYLVWEGKGDLYATLK